MASEQAVPEPGTGTGTGTGTDVAVGAGAGTGTGTATRIVGSLPGAVSLGLWRARIELISYFRKSDAVVFTFAYPIIMLLIFGAIFKGDVQGTDVEFRQVFAAGITATGIMNVGFQALAISIANDRSLGLLKRLRGLPMPKVSYFLGKLVQALVAGVLQTALLLVIAITLFHLQIPGTGARWFTLVWVFLLGMTACATLGIACSSLPKDGRTAASVILPPFLVLQFKIGRASCRERV